MGVTIPSAAGEVLEQYEVSNSLRFNNDGASDGSKLSRSVSGNLSKAHTFSLWVKRGNLKASGRQVLAAMGDGSGDISWLEFNNDRLAMIFDGAGNYFPKTDAVFRDPSAWYHIVAKVDTTQSSASERLKLYVNGTQFTDTSGTNPPQNHQAAMDACVIGFNGGDEFDGYMAEFHFLDGAAYDPTYFGRFDANGVWVPKKYTGGNYGTNGFYFEFKQTGTSANSSGIGADTSGEDHHFTPESLAATDITEDTCTNNFATMNPLESDRQQGGAATFAEGNLQITTSYVDANYQRYPQVYSTQAVSSGKWYFEMKISTSDTDSFIGVHSPDNYASDSTTNPYGGYASTGAIYTSRGAVRINDAQTTGLGTTSQNDIVGCALDIDNNKVYFHKNGTYVQSGDPAGNSGGQAIPSGYIYGFTVGNDTSSNSGTMQVNFGNPVHTISSGNTDGKYGNFEYAVPSGFYAVCTKRLAEFG
jgi:hypothetical protein